MAVKPKYRQPGFGRRVLRFAPYVLAVAASVAGFAVGYWLMGPVGFWSLGLVVTFGAYRIVGARSTGVVDAWKGWARIEGRRRSKIRDAIEHQGD